MISVDYVALEKSCFFILLALFYLCYCYFVLVSMCVCDFFLFLCFHPYGLLLLFFSLSNNGPNVWPNKWNVYFFPSCIWFDHWLLFLFFSILFSVALANFILIHLFIQSFQIRLIVYWLVSFLFCFVLFSSNNNVCL